MAVYLSDLQQPHIVSEVGGSGGFTSAEKLAALPEVAALGWPLEVVKQWLYDHLEWHEFLRDYAELDLSAVVWTLEYVPLAEFMLMTSGPSDNYLATVPDLHEHWTERRRHLGVADAWEDTGTWLVPPLLLDLACLDGSAGLLQLVEGRTRVGILQGRARDGLHVAGRHATWIGRPRAE